MEGCCLDRFVKTFNMSSFYENSGEYVHQSNDYYLMYFLSKSYQFVLDRYVDTPGNVKYLVDGFNAVQKKHLATCLRMRSTPEKK